LIRLVHQLGDLPQHRVVRVVAAQDRLEAAVTAVVGQLRAADVERCGVGGESVGVGDEREHRLNVEEPPDHQPAIGLDTNPPVRSLPAAAAWERPAPAAARVGSGRPAMGRPPASATCRQVIPCEDLPAASTSTRAIMIVIASPTTVSAHRHPTAAPPAAAPVRHRTAAPRTDRRRDGYCDASWQVVFRSPWCH
jgi:hypothetical protein